MAAVFPCSAPLLSAIGLVESVNFFGAQRVEVLFYYVHHISIFKAVAEHSWKGRIFLSKGRKFCHRGAVRLINESGVFSTDASVCLDVLIYEALCRRFGFFPSPLMFYYPISTLETASFFHAVSTRVGSWTFPLCLNSIFVKEGFMRKVWGSGEGIASQDLQKLRLKSIEWLARSFLASQWSVWDVHLCGPSWLPAFSFIYNLLIYSSLHVLTSTPVLWGKEYYLYFTQCM